MNSPVARVIRPRILAFACLVGLAGCAEASAFAEDAAALARRCAQMATGTDRSAALEICDRAIAAAPRNAGPLVGRSAAQNGMKRYDQAIADATAALALNPRVAAAYNNRGLAHYRKGDAVRAIADYNEALRIDGRYRHGLMNRGIALRQTGALDASLGDFNAMIALFPKDGYGYAHRALTLLRQRQLGPAFADSTIAVELCPRDAFVRNAHGLVQEGRGAQDDARTSFALAMVLDPGFKAAAENHRRVAARQPVSPSVPEATGDAALPLPTPEVAPPPAAPPEVQPAPETARLPAPGTQVRAGSGVVLQDGLTVVTNHHVIVDASEFRVRTAAGGMRVARLLASSVADDLALLRIDAPFPGQAGVALATGGRPAQGARITVIGYPNASPYGPPQAPAVATGHVVTGPWLAQATPSFFTTTPVTPGQSGSPALDASGRLVGVMRAALRYPGGLRVTDAMSVGTPTDRILLLLGGAAPRPAVPARGAAPGQVDRPPLSSVVMVAAFR